MDAFDPHDADADWWAEAHDLVDSLGHTLVSAQGAASAPLLPRHVDAMFRDAHTLKGLLRTLNAAELAELASSIEDALEHLRMGRWPNSQQTTHILLHGIETLAAGCARLQSGVPLDEAALLSANAQFASPQSSTQDHMTEPVLDPIAHQELEDLSDLERHRVEDAARHGQRIVRIVTRLPVDQLEQGFVDLERGLLPYGEVLARAIHHVPEDDNQIALDFLLALMDGQSDLASIETVLHANARVHAVQASDVAHSWTTSTPQGFDPPFRAVAPASAPRSVSQVASPKVETTAPVVPQRSNLLPSTQQTTTLAPLRQASAGELGAAQTVRVDIRRLDRLLHSVSELMLAKQGFEELSERVKLLPGGMGIALEMARHKEALDKKTSALQAGLMQVRMVPIGQLFERLLRAGQQAAHELGKEVRFSLHGEATELDKHIAERLVDPMMHLVRNAVDHGIERPDVRRAKGKTTYGTVRLSARTRGRQVVVQVADDGAGIDLEKARATAIEKHLIAPQAAPLLDEHQIYALLSQPGFSTRREVSAYSGRGVGLDVAKTELEGLGGALEVAANEPCGSTFSLVTPVTLAIVSALIVSSANERYALPLGHVTETLAFEPRDVFDAGARRMLRVGDHVMPLTELAESFGLCAHKRISATQYVVVVSIGTKRLALLVDDLLTQQEIVIKSLGARMSDNAAFAGAADVGTPQMVLVLNTLSLLHESETAALTAPSAHGKGTDATQ